jgi:septal ring-binding cell division protein DamX
MRRISARAALVIALSYGASAAAQSTPYNTTDTFQPGKKYTCVPTADRKGWDCNEIGKPGTSPRATPDPPAPASPVTQESPPAPAPVSKAERASTLPSYLTSAAASNTAPPAQAPSTISATANHANAPPMQAEPTPAPSAEPPVMAKPAAQTHALPRPAPAAPVRETPRAAASANGDFMALAGDRFVIELAHASRQSDLAAARAAVQIPRGDLYEVHLRQNNADAWLLVWGSFDTIDAARVARGELAQRTSAPVGWPRRVAPLQAEARRVSE